MRKTSLFALIGLSMLFSSCDELENLCGVGSEDLKFSEDYTNQLSTAIYVYQISDRALRDSTLMATGNAEIDGAICTLTADSLIIDFDNGVSGSDGTIRKGSIRMNHSGDYQTAGSSIGIHLSNYSENDRLTEGNFDVFNTTSTASLPQYNIVVDGLRQDTLQLDGTFDAGWLSGFTSQNTDDDNFSLAGNAVLLNTNNTEEFAGNIDSPVEISTSCDYGFVSGIISITPSNPDYPFVTLDFIDGDCANLFQATIDCEGNNFSFSYPIK